MQRYLRKIYRDPITGKVQWGLVEAPGGGIMGVYSLSRDAPIKKAGFAEQQEGFGEAGDYADWKFVYQPPPPVIGAASPLLIASSTLIEILSKSPASSFSQK